MYILGISCYYHDAAACIIHDGKLIAAVEEERFSRKKHDNSFPRRSIKYCLKEAGISMKQVDHVAFYEKPLLKFERILHTHIAFFPKSYRAFLQTFPSWFSEKLRVKKTLKSLNYKRNIHFIPHHVSHAASAFLLSPFKQSAILIADGVGEWATTTLALGSENQITLLKEVTYPHSIGLLYSTITAYLGFSVNNSEYKVMGLSAYGNHNRSLNPYYNKLTRCIDLKPDGSFLLDLTYFAYPYKNVMPSQKLCDLLGGPIATRDTIMISRHFDIAAALQMLTEDALTLQLTHLHHETKCDHLVLAGGVALNSVYNGKILNCTPFKRVWIQPNAGDGGGSLGAAYFVYHTILNHTRSKPMNTAYLGPEYSSKEIKGFLDANKIKYQTIADPKALVKTTAQLLAKNNVVGWFQGKMEWGPRALGNRSILANPSHPNMQHILNHKVKHRELFRPFAPAVCVKDALEFFECGEELAIPTRYMLMVYPVKEKWKDKIPAVVHVDGTSRIQAVGQQDNPLFYDLIQEFGQCTSIPMLINTSFNVRGEPIVCTPYDAYRCMMGTQIDYLSIDKFIIKRSDNLHHAWVSQ